MNKCFLSSISSNKVKGTSGARPMRGFYLVLSSVIQTNLYSTTISTQKLLWTTKMRIIRIIQGKTLRAGFIKKKNNPRLTQLCLGWERMIFIKQIIISYIIIKYLIPIYIYLYLGFNCICLFSSSIDNLIDFSANLGEIKSFWFRLFSH